MILSTGLLAYCLAAAPAVEPPPSPPVEPAALPATANYNLATTAPQDDEGLQISYTYAEIGIAQNDLDDLGNESDEVDIYYVEGSLGLGEHFYVLAGYERHELDLFDTEADLLTLGGGIHFGLLPKLDVFGDIAWLFNDVTSDLDALSDSESGYMIRGGARWMPIDWDRGGLELQGDLLWLSLDNWIGSDNELTGFELGARAHFLKLFSVGAMYSILEDDDQVALNARVSF